MTVRSDLSISFIVADNLVIGAAVRNVVCRGPESVSADRSSKLVGALSGESSLFW